MVTELEIQDLAFKKELILQLRTINEYLKKITVELETMNNLKDVANQVSD